MSAPHATVLVVDDEEAIVFGLRRYLENRGYAVELPALATLVERLVEPGRNARASLSLVEAERRHIAQVLKSRHGHVAEAARVLGLSRSALYQKLKKHQIPTRSRAGA